MRMRLKFLASVLLLAGCDSTVSDGPPKDQEASDVGDALDEKAVEAGILPDLDNLVFAGRFETRSELGTDKFCAVKNGASNFKIGILAVFGPESKCEARGTASVDQETVQISLAGKESCSFDAGYDGIELRFPGAIPEGCASYCSPRASFSGTSYFMVEPGDESARRALGRDFDRLCS